MAIINGTSGNDDLFGTKRDDIIDGGDGNDIIDGDNGDDTIEGGSGSDIIAGGKGRDLIFGEDGDDVLDGEDGDDLVDGGIGNDHMIGGKGRDSLFGGSGNDLIDGDDSDDDLDGGDGDDSLLGGGGRDSIGGGAGNDMIVAGIGRDTLSGGSENDLFVFNATSATSDSDTLAMDSITDFSSGEDKIDLSSLLGSSDLSWGFNAPTANGVWFQQSGGNTFLYADVNGDSATAELAIQINGLHSLSNADFIGVTNNAPVAVADTNAVIEDQQPNPVVGDVLANDSDADAGTRIVVSSPGTYVGQYGVLTLSTDGNYSYMLNNAQVLAQGQVAHDVFAYAASDGITDTPSVLDITVTGTNDGPVAVADSATGAENQSLIIDVLVNDNDVDNGHVLSLLAAAAPPNKGSVSIANNQLIFSPGNDFDHLTSGSTELVVLSYEIQDEFGAVSSSTVTLTVTGTNDGPVAAADSATGTENQTVTIDVVANDSDVDDGHILALSSVAAPANKGSVSIANNHLVFEPGIDFDHLALGATEQVTLNYEVRDEFGAVSNSTVAVTVAGTNDAPIAFADSASGTENLALVIDVLANDIDVDDGNVLTLISAAVPVNKGTVSIADNQLVFDPGSDFNYLALGATEQVTLTYQIQDEFGKSSISTVALTVAGTNNGPIAAADSAGGTENQILTIDVLANDADVDDGFVLTLVTATAPANKGSVAVANNQLIFNPGSDFDHLAEGETELVTLTYQIEDQFGAPSSSTVTVTVTGTNDVPIAAPDNASGAENQILPIDVLVNDIDVDDGNVLTLVAVSAPASKGSVAIVNNQLVFNPGTDFDHLAQGATEQVVLSYHMQDESGAPSDSTVTVTVTGANDAPLAVADSADGTEVDMVTIDVLANDTDIDDGHQLTLVSANVPAGKGTVSIMDNQLVFDPGSDFSYLAQGATEQVVLNYTIRDEFGAFSSGTVALTLTGMLDQTVDPVTIDTLIGTDTGATVTIGSGGSTKDATLTLTGTAEAGSTVTVFDGANALGNATLTDTTWTFTTPVLSSGAHGLTARVVDAAGNAATTGTVMATVDTAAPTLSSSTPADNATMVLGSSAVVLTFNEAVKAGAGNFVISNGAGDTRTIGITDSSQVTISGNTVTIRPTASLLGNAGYSLEFAGGVIQDLVGNAYAGNGSASAINFVTAPAGVLPLSNLNGSAGFRLDGAMEGDLSGWSVSSAGDVNGDGFDDLIIGAVGADPNGSFSGSSFVVFGKASGFGANMNLAGLNGSNGFRLDGLATEDRSGWSVSAAGDINGDGFDDLLVGAKLADPNGSASGAGYVVFGKASGFGARMALSSLNGSNGFRLDGAAEGDQSGYSVSTAGDVNGDGFDDVIIGAPFADPNGSASGASYVVFGKASGFAPVANLSSLDGSNGFRLQGVVAGGQAGWAVSDAGDINGDGFDDLLVSAPYTHPNRAGSVYVVFGKASGFSPSMDLAGLFGLNGSNGFRLDGIELDRFGNSVSSAGDVNGDGVDDFVVGAPLLNGSVAPGSSYVVFGKTSGFDASMDVSSLNGSNGFRLDGTIGITSGASVSTAGDINGDGFDDLLVSAPNAEPSGSNSGAAYVVFGKASGFGASMSLSSVNGSNGFRLDGQAIGGRFGWSMSAAGDVNGDGFDDLVVGAPMDRPNGSWSGASYVVFGNDFNNAVSFLGSGNADTLTGTATAESFVGGGGSDTLTGGGGADVLYGGEGDDTISVFDLTFRRADGGNGDDTLRLSGAGMHLNLADFRNKVGGIETIDLTGSGNNTLGVTSLDLLNVSDSSNMLKVVGDSGDTVNIGNGWIDGGIAGGYQTYTLGQAVLLIGVEVAVLA